MRDSGGPNRGIRGWLAVRSALVVVTVVLAQLLPPANTAEALVEGLTRDTDTELAYSDPTRLNHAICADGYAIGVGGKINGGARQVGLTGLIPSSTDQFSTALAEEDDDGYGSNWSLTTYAICAEALSGLEHISEVSSSDSSQFKTVSLICPDGKKVIAAGGKVVSPLRDGGASANNVFLYSVFVAAGNGSGSVSAQEDEDGTPEIWRLEGHATCVDGPLTGLQTVSSNSSYSSNEKKSATATCPPGKKVLGAGGFTQGGGQVTFDGIVPNESLTSVTASAHEDESGFSENWFVRAHAVCVNPSELGLVRIHASTAADNPDGSKDVQTGFCPGGRRVYGAGARVNGGSGRIALTRMQVLENLSSTFAQGQHNAGPAQDWSIVAYAICGDPLFGLEMITDSSVQSSSDGKLVIASCPPGKKVVGMGAWMFNGYHVVLNQVVPSEDLDWVLVSAHEDEFAQPSLTWQVGAQAVCAPPLPGLEHVIAYSQINSVSPKSVTVSCPQGKRVTGVGGDITWGDSGQVLITALRPATNLRSITVRADESYPGYSSNWFLRGDAICVSSP